MRILLLWDYYEPYLRSFYASRSGLAKLSYEKQALVLADDCGAWPPSIAGPLRSIGHEVTVIVGNAEPMQSMWAWENGLVCRQMEDWKIQIAREQVRLVKPDVLWVIGSPSYLGRFIQDVRKDCGCVIAWIGIRWASRPDLKGVDCVTSSHQNLIEWIRSEGCRCEHLLPCFDPGIEERTGGGQRDVDVSFVGNLNISSFERRLRMLNYISRKIRLRIYTEGISWRRRPLPAKVFLRQLTFLPFVFRTRFDSAVYGLDMFRVLSRSRIAFNVHTDSAEGLAGNIRMFEATGCGALLLTEAAANLNTIFEPEKEVVTYRGASEAVDKIRYYLQNEDERREISEAGREKVLSAHNNKFRAMEFLDIVKNI